MRRVSRKDLLDSLYVALTVLRPPAKRALCVDVEKVRAEVAEALVHRVMGSPENEAVLLRPSMVTERQGHRPGIWGEDEPHPDAYLPPAPEPGPPPTASGGSPTPER